jgi:hypothetical protein
LAAFIHGQRLCGKVDRVPGLFYVSTKFFHVDYMPLFPVGSYLVIEGTEQGEKFHGTKIKMRWKSVMAGLLRSWLAIFTISGAGGASNELAKMLFGKHESWSYLAQAGMVIAVCGVFIFVLASSRRVIYPVLGILIVASVAVLFGCHSLMNADPVFRLENANAYAMVTVLLFSANLAAFLYTLTRLMLPASYPRALALAEIAGVPREVIEGIYHSETAKDVEDDAYADRSWMEETDARNFG